MLRKTLISITMLISSISFTQATSAASCGEVITTACSSGVVSAAQYSASQCSACGGYNSASVGGGCYQFSCKSSSAATPQPTPSPAPVSSGCSSGVVDAASTAANVCGIPGFHSINTGNGCYSFYCN